MSDMTYVGRKIKSFQSSPQFDGFSRVVIVVSDEIEFSAGTELGRTLRLTNPWGSQQMAEDILESVRGFQYQPYTAEGAFLDPSVELGDGITANNVYGGVYTQAIKFGPMMTATVAAPEDEEINHEYPYKSKPNKEITREARLLRASLAIEADRITAEVEERKSAVATLNAMLEVQAGLIEAKVSKTGGDASSFGWEMTNTFMLWKANGTKIFNLDKNGAEVYGKIVAQSGKIGGFDVLSNYLSYNNQTWGGTNSTGIYAGPQGIQCGAAENGVQITNNGYLYAEHGEFRGTIRAGNIQYGGNAGYFSGGGISSGSISGNRMQANTITTSYTSAGINSALANGNYAANLFTGVRDYGASIKIGTVSCETLYQGGSGFTKKSVTIKDYYGDNVTISYWG